MIPAIEISGPMWGGAAPVVPPYGIVLPPPAHVKPEKTFEILPPTWLWSRLMAMNLQSRGLLFFFEGG